MITLNQQMAVFENNLTELIQVTKQIGVDYVSMRCLAGEWRVELTRGTLSSGNWHTKNILPNEALVNAIIALNKAIEENNE